MKFENREFRGELSLTPPGQRGASIRNRVLLFVFVFLFLVVPLHAQFYTILPQFTTGGGWSADIFCDNQGIVAANGILISTINSNGTPMVVDTNIGSNSSFTLNLNPGATQIIRVPSTGPLRVGYVSIRIPSGFSVRCSEVFRYAPGGIVQTELGVPQQFPFIHFSFPAEVNTALGINTGVAFANGTFGSSLAVAQQVIVDIIRTDGTLQNTAIVPVGLGEQKALFLNEPGLFPGLNNFSGTVSVSAAIRIGVLGLRQDGGVFGSLSIDGGAILPPFLLNTTPVAELESNNTTGLAQMLPGTTLVSGAIGVPGDTDYFKFTGNAGDIVTALLEAQTTGSLLDSVLQLENSSGTVISRNDQNGLLFMNDSFLRVVLPASGTYYLRVTDFFGAGGVTYTYKLHLRIQPGSAPPPSGGSNYNGNWSGTTGQGKSFTFTISNDALTTLTLSGAVSCISNFTMTVTGNLPLTGASISFTIPGGPGSVTLSVTGSFTSFSTASGIATFTAIPPPCSGSIMTSWTATKN